MKNITNLQSERLLPLCEEDAPQSGRSMIEMLGVLAIIGVLSVGGIAGYSKAMQKYRTNKTIEQVTQIANGVRTLYSSQQNYSGLDNSVLKKAKILPESAFEGNEPKNPFGGFTYINSSPKYYNGSDAARGKAFRLSMTALPDDACIELVTQDWGDATGFNGLSVNTNSTVFIDNCTSEINGNTLTQCAKDGPVTIENAMNACNRNASSTSQNLIYWYFY